MLTFLVLTAIVLTLLLMGWLTYDRDLTSMKAWQDQIGKWQQSLEAFIHPAVRVGKPKEQRGDSNSARSMPESLPQPGALIDQEPAPEPLPLTETQIGPSPEFEPLPQAEALVESKLELEPESVAQPQTEQPAPVSESATGLSTSAIPYKVQIIFDFDSAELSEEARKSLNDIARTFTLSSSGRIGVMGYADEHGDRNYNIALSHRRANTVAQYLVDRGVDPEILVVQGLGIYEEDLGGITVPGTQGRIVQLEVQVGTLSHDAPFD